MSQEQREWIFWIAAALFGCFVCLLAVWSSPDFLPMNAVVYESPPTQMTASDSLQNAEGKININTADAETLMQLDGLGEVTADKIIRYREANGAFGSVEELKNVNGIGEKKLQAWRPYITV